MHRKSRKKLDRNFKDLMMICSKTPNKLFIKFNPQTRDSILVQEYKLQRSRKRITKTFIFKRGPEECKFIKKVMLYN